MMKSRKRKEHCCCSLLLNAINFDDAAFVCVCVCDPKIETNRNRRRFEIKTETHSGDVLIIESVRMRNSRLQQQQPYATFETGCEMWNKKGDLESIVVTAAYCSLFFRCCWLSTHLSHYVVPLFSILVKKLDVKHLKFTNSYLRNFVIFFCYVFNCHSLLPVESSLWLTLTQSSHRFQIVMNK